MPADTVFPARPVAFPISAAEQPHFPCRIFFSTCSQPLPIWHGCRPQEAGEDVQPSPERHTGLGISTSCSICLTTLPSEHLLVLFCSRAACHLSVCLSVTLSSRTVSSMRAEVTWRDQSLISSEPPISGSMHREAACGRDVERDREWSRGWG